MFSLIELDLIFLKGSAVSSSVFWSVYGFDMALGSLSDNVQSCIHVFLKDRVRGAALGLAGSWVELGLNVDMEAFGDTLIY